MTGAERGPVVVVGAHVPGILIDVQSVPGEGETVLASSWQEPLDGGKSTNQAVAAARLGTPTALVTVVGSDERGRRALELFAAEGIDLSGCFQLDGPTDLGLVMLPPSRIPAIVSVLDRNRELDATRVRASASLVRSAAVVVCALEALQEAAVAAFALANECGASTVLNPAPAAEMDAELLKLTEILVPNEHEAAILAGEEGSPGELARLLAERFPVGAVVVTAGSEGAFVAAQGELERVPAPPVQVVDSTGAGDAFIGALASRLRLGCTVVAAARFAVVAASVSVTRSGTMSGFPTAPEVARLRRQTQLT